MTLLSENDLSFSNYIATLRKKKGLTQEKLSEGICNASILNSWEKGRRTPDNLVLERLLDRLGVERDSLQELLGQDKYEQWSMRTRILYRIREKDFEEAKTLLKKYEESVDLTFPLEEQFCLRIHSMILMGTKGSASKIYQFIDKALKLTVPEIDQRPLESFALSIQELDMILDRNYYSDQPDEALYEDVTNYTTQDRFEPMAQAKILPKAVVLLCQNAYRTKKDVTVDDYNHHIVLLDIALSLLRQQHSLYYLWEILSLRNNLYEKIITLKDENTNLKSLYQENRNWLQTLSSIYETYQVPKESRDSADAYLVRRVECLNDVMRIRREMLGLSLEELCEGICSVRTLRRIEAGETTPQYSVANPILERLGLPPIGPRSELLLNNQTMNSTLNTFKRALIESNQMNSDRAFLSIQQSAALESKYNLQYIQNSEAYSLWKKGVYTNKEFLARMKAIISISIPWDKILTSPKKYFTSNEIIYIYRATLGMDPSSTEYSLYHAVLEEYFLEKINTETAMANSSMYDFLLDNIQSYWGNCGEYDKSNHYNESGIIECLKKRALGAIIHFHYGIWWNNQQKNTKAHSNSEFPSIKVLNECAELADLFNCTSDKDFFHDKIRNLL